MSLLNTQILLAARPDEEPAEKHFRLVETEIESPSDGELLLQTIYLSLDPYMRARMYEGANYAASVALGSVMIGETVSKVIESRHPGFEVGEYVLSWHGWQTFSLSDGKGLRKVNPAIAPVSTALHVLGLTGLTAYGGLLRYGRPQREETLLVSAASGAVGSVVAQIGKLKGLTVVGIAGGAEKCRYLIEDLGLDAAIDHRAGNVSEQLAETCPDGIDIYFDNIAGDVAKDVLPLMRPRGRYLVCGTIAVNRNLASPDGPDHLQDMLASILVKQLTVQGFIFNEFQDMTADFACDMSEWIKGGDIRYREDIVDGLEHAPRAFLGLFSGQNRGKLLVKV